MLDNDFNGDGDDLPPASIRNQQIINQRLEKAMRERNATAFDSLVVECAHQMRVILDYAGRAHVGRAEMQDFVSLRRRNALMVENLARHISLFPHLVIKDATVEK